MQGFSCWAAAGASQLPLLLIPGFRCHSDRAAAAVSVQAGPLDAAACFASWQVNRSLQLVQMLELLQHSLGHSAGNT